jgi:hypothetical protein
MVSAVLAVPDVARNEKSTVPAFTSAVKAAKEMMAQQEPVARTSSSDFFSILANMAHPSFSSIRLLYEVHGWCHYFRIENAFATCLNDRVFWAEKVFAGQVDSLGAV